MSPQVSVLISAFNAGEFIDQSVGSALAQSFADLEVIVVNDGSTDDTARRLARRKDPRLRVIEQSNQGLAAAYNAGVRAAQGTFIGFLDADDVWFPRKLERHIRVHQDNPGLDVTFSWVHMIDAEGKPVRVPCPRWRGAVSFPQLLTDYVIRTSSAAVMRRDAFERAGPLDSTLVRCIDFEFFLRVSLLRPGNLCAIEEVLTSYRRHPNQRTRDWRRVRQGWNQMLAGIRMRAPAETKRVEKVAASNFHRYLASVAYEEGNFGDACRLICRAYSLAPVAFVRDPRNWKMAAAAIAGIALPEKALLMVERSAGFDRPIEINPSGKSS